MIELALAFGLAITDPQPPEVNVVWAMVAPEGGWTAEPKAETATWPQTLGDINALACGVWYQSDWYLADEAARFTADGILDYKEDWATDTQRGALRWSFVYGGDCVEVPPVEESPVVTVPETIVPVPTLAETGVIADKATVFWIGAGLALTIGFGLIIVGRRMKEKDDDNDQ